MNNKICIHWECPYHDCNFHEVSSGIYKEAINTDKDLPIYLPQDETEVDSCTSYMDR